MIAPGRYRTFRQLVIDVVLQLILMTVNDSYRPNISERQLDSVSEYSNTFGNLRPQSLKRYPSMCSGKNQLPST